MTCWTCSMRRWLAGFYVWQIVLIGLINTKMTCWTLCMEGCIKDWSIQRLPTGLYTWKVVLRIDQYKGDLLDSIYGRLYYGLINLKMTCWTLCIEDCIKDWYKDDQLVSTEGYIKDWLINIKMNCWSLFMEG